MHRTALGAAEVPEVNNSTHSVSTSGSRPGSPVPGAHCSRADVERLAHGAVAGRRRRRSARTRAAPPGRAEVADHRRQQVLVTGLGDEQLHVGVADVGEQVLVAPRVVEAHHHRPGQGRAGQAEHVLGGVVEQDRHVRRAGRVEALAEQRRVPARLGVASRRGVQVRSPKCKAGRGAKAGSVPLRRSSAAALARAGVPRPAAAPTPRRSATSGGATMCVRDAAAFSDHGVRLDKRARR